MTSRMHWVYQALAMVGQALNLYGGMVPPKYQPFVAAGLAIVQAGLGLYNHYYTPDGKRIAATLILMLLLASGTLAQTAPTPTQHFVVNVDAAGYNGQGTQSVMEAGAGFQVTKNVGVGYFQISNPTDGTQPKYHMGTVNYTRELRALIGKKIASKLVFDTTNWLVTFQAGGGKVNYANVNRIAEVGGVFITRPVANNLAITCGYQILHGQGTSVLTRNVSQQPSMGLNFTF